MEKEIKELTVALKAFLSSASLDSSYISPSLLIFAEIVYLPFMDGAVEEMTFNIKKDLVYDSSNFDEKFELCDYTPIQIKGIINELSTRKANRLLKVHFGGSNNHYLKCKFSFKELDCEIFKFDVIYFCDDQSNGKTYCTLE